MAEIALGEKGFLDGQWTLLPTFCDDAFTVFRDDFKLKRGLPAIFSAKSWTVAGIYTVVAEHLLLHRQVLLDHLLVKGLYPALLNALSSIHDDEVVGNQPGKGELLFNQKNGQAELPI